jgi:hypothetical protein
VVCGAHLPGWARSRAWKRGADEAGAYVSGAFDHRFTAGPSASQGYRGALHLHTGPNRRKDPPCPCGQPLCRFAIDLIAPERDGLVKMPASCGDPHGDVGSFAPNSPMCPCAVPRYIDETRRASRGSRLGFRDRSTKCYIGRGAHHDELGNHPVSRVLSSSFPRL